MIRFIYATDNQINDDSVCILRSLSVRYQITSKLMALFQREYPQADQRRRLPCAVATGIRGIAASPRYCGCLQPPRRAHSLGRLDSLTVSSAGPSASPAHVHIHVRLQVDASTQAADYGDMHLRMVAPSWAAGLRAPGTCRPRRHRAMGCVTTGIARPRLSAPEFSGRANLASLG